MTTQTFTTRRRKFTITLNAAGEVVKVDVEPY